MLIAMAALNEPGHSFGRHPHRRRALRRRRSDAGGPGFHRSRPCRPGNRRGYLRTPGRIDLLHPKRRAARPLHDQRPHEPRRHAAGRIEHRARCCATDRRPATAGDGSRPNTGYGYLSGLVQLHADSDSIPCQRAAATQRHAGGSPTAGGHPHDSAPIPLSNHRRVGAPGADVSNEVQSNYESYDQMLKVERNRQIDISF